MPPSRPRTVSRERRIDRINWMEFAEIVPRHVARRSFRRDDRGHGITSLGTDNEIPTRLSEALADRPERARGAHIPYGVTAHLGALAGARTSRPCVHRVRRSR